MKLINDWPAFWRGFVNGVQVVYFAAATLATVAVLAWLGYAVAAGLDGAFNLLDKLDATLMGLRTWWYRG